MHCQIGSTCPDRTVCKKSGSSLALPQPRKLSTLLLNQRNTYLLDKPHRQSCLEGCTHQLGMDHTRGFQGLRTRRSHNQRRRCHLMPFSYRLDSLHTHSETHLGRTPLGKYHTMSFRPASTSQDGSRRIETPQPGTSSLLRSCCIARCLPLRMSRPDSCRMQSPKRPAPCHGGMPHSW